jgi:hypothetical protein
MIAVTVVITMAAGMAWEIKSTPPVYQESARVIFMAPGVNPYSAFSQDLIPTANMMTATMTGPEYRRQVRAAGGMAEFDLALVNLYNEQFPDYGLPYVTATTESANPAATSRTFTIVIDLFRRLVWVRQVQAGVPPGSRISTRIVADTGAQAQPGSRKRALGGLAALTLIAVFLVTGFLDRHSLRRGSRGRPKRIAWRTRQPSLSA